MKLAKSGARTGAGISLRARAGMAALAAVTGFAVGGSASADSRVLAFTGQAAPGGGTYTGTGFDTYNVNNAGQVATFWSVTGNNGFFRLDGVGDVAVARGSDPAPGGGTYTTFWTFLTENSGGQVAFAADVSTGARIIVRGEGLTTTRLVGTGDVAPGIGGGTFTSSINVLFGLNDAGQVAFSATPSAGGAGLFRVDAPGSLSAYARVGDAVPGGGLFTSFGVPFLNGAGQSSFWGSSTIGGGLFRGDGAGGLSLYATIGNAAPGGGTFTSFSHTAPLNNAGQIAFVATNSGASGKGVYRAESSGGVLGSYALAGQPAGGLLGNFVNFSDVAINGAGQAAFSATTTGGSGMFRGDGPGSFTPLTTQGQGAPDGNGVFGAFTQTAGLNSAGVAMFPASLTGTAGGTADNQGIYLADGNQVIQVARTGQLVNGSPIATLDAQPATAGDQGGRKGLNDFGQVVYNADLANGNHATVLFTPDLHWRGGNSSWDAGGNWTLGLTPARVHDVFIDPVSYLTVTGPSANTTVKSLTILNRGTFSQTSLVLNTAVALNVSGALGVLANGSVDVQQGALAAGSLSNGGSFSVESGGSFSSGPAVNTGTMNVLGSVSIAGTLENDSGLQVFSGGQLSASAGITNLSSFTMSGGMLTGGSILNDAGGVLTGHGTVAPLLTNRGTVNVGGFVPSSGLLDLSAGMNNSGTVNAGAAQTLRSAGAINNSGVINLTGGGIIGAGAVNNNAGGVIQGGGTIGNALTNNGGIISSTSTSTPLALGNFTTNPPAGQIRVFDGAFLTIGTSLANSGLITLKGSGAVLSGPSVSNTGTIKGAGQITGPVANAGIIRAEAGELDLTAAGNSNPAAGQIQAGAGATVLYTSGLAANAGTIALTGGAFDNNNQPLTNSGSILGSGTFRSGGLTNTGTISFADAASGVVGPVTNNAGGVIKVTSNTTTFFGTVTNNPGGTIKTTSATARFLAPFTNNGVFSSDPADNFFADLSVGITGALSGGVGDRFFVAGDLSNASTLAGVWDTRSAELHLAGSAAHVMTTPGVDRGASFAGYDQNFAWGMLELAAGESLTVGDADLAPGAALYVGDLILDGGVGQLTLLRTAAADVNVYYDATRPANAYLSAQSYALVGGGMLAPVPEPAAWLAPGAAGVGFLLARRARRSIPSCG